ncbi:MAG TPA: helix-turn-helix domain-containing protein [Pyrinomonadaceae bacterium]|jgi:hypothetical protein
MNWKFSELGNSLNAKETKKLLDKEAVSVTEFCRMFGICKGTAFKLNREKRLKFTKIFRRTVILKSEIIRFISELEHQ